MSVPDPGAARRREIHTLHRYWIWADQMRLLFEGELGKVGSAFDADDTSKRRSLTLAVRELTL